jgi:hypothetical protein
VSFDYASIGALGRSDILRSGSVRVFDPIKSGIAVDAAKRTDSDCAEKILLHGAVAMRPKYLRAATMWTESFGVSLHFHYAFPGNKAA